MIIDRKILKEILETYDSLIMISEKMPGSAHDEQWSSESMDKVKREYEYLLSLQKLSNIFCTDEPCAQREDDVSICCRSCPDVIDCEQRCEQHPEDCGKIKGGS